MDIDVGVSDFEEMDSDDAPPPPKRKAAPAAPKAKTTRAPAKAPAKKAPAKGKAKKIQVWNYANLSDGYLLKLWYYLQSDSDEVITLDDDDDDDEEEPPKPAKRTNRADVLRWVLFVLVLQWSPGIWMCFFSH